MLISYHDRCDEKIKIWDWQEVERTIVLQWYGKTSEHVPLNQGPGPLAEA
jgi:hypothetical protein